MIVFRGGTVLTGEPTRPSASAVAVEDGVVAALGEDALALRRRADEVIDLAGHTLVPAFRDGHIHPLWGGAETLDAPIVDAVDVDDVVERVAGFAHDHPERSWVTGHGYPPEIVPGGVGMAEWLDAAVSDRPCALWSSDHHMVWCNTLALEAAGIDAQTPDPPRGRIVRDGAGAPVGTLLESAEELVTALIPPRTSAELAEGLEVALERMRSAGIVWAQEAALAPEDLDAYLAVRGRGRLTCDVNVAFRVDPERWQEQREGFLAARSRAESAAAEPASGRLTARTVKLFADGVIEGGTGALLEPYVDQPDSRGIANWTPEELARAVAAFDADGFQPHIHAIGDAAVRMSLDAVAHAREVNGPRDRRAVITHVHLVHPDDRPRFATLGVVANFEPLWAQQDPIMTDLTEPRLGAERSAWQYPIRSILDSGAPVSFGSDWPVSSLVPMEGIAVAVTRQTREGRPTGGWLPDERISLADALRCYTIGSAYQAFDDGAGVLRPGAPADLCVLDADPATLPPADLHDVGVVATWRRGEEVFHR